MSPLFFQTFIYLLAAVIAVPIAKRFGLSAVLGYLLAGMLIGPFGLRLVGEEGESVMHFAEFGVVIMLFLIGLELQPSMLWKLRAPILGLGGAQVVLTSIAIFGIVLVCGLSWQVALAIGLTLALSSTAIVMQSLQEKGLSTTAGGRSAFSVLLFQDIAVIPILAIFPVLATFVPAEGEDGHSAHASGFQDWLNHQPAWVGALLVLAAVAIIIIAGRVLMRPILRVIARTRVREAFVGLALLLIIGIALLMNSLGVSAALGTFLAGVVLADSEYRHELEADIEPFKGLLLGVFFISVGAAIDFSLLLSKPILIFSVVFGLVILKAAILWVLGGVWKLKTDQRFLFSLSLAQGGEFAFVLGSVGLAEGVFSEPVSQLLTVSVAVTMALSPLIMLFDEKVLRPRFGTMKAVERPDDQMDERAPVILAGMGKFGNFIARMLLQEGVECTVVDNDSDHIDMLRRYGLKAFYGDATRYDLLASAGASDAKLLIIALNDPELICKLVETARKHFPHLIILSRAQSMEHQYQLLGLGVDELVHQNQGSAVHLAQIALTKLGHHPHRATRASKSFQNSERGRIKELAKIWEDRASFVEAVRGHVRELEEQFKQSQSRKNRPNDLAWDIDKLRQDLKKGEFLEQQKHE